MYKYCTLDKELGGLGFTLAESCREQRRLSYYAHAAALAVNMHLYWVGVAAQLRRAVECADAQKARSLQLRASVMLDRLLHNGGERVQARQLLHNCYKQFTEGFDTADLQEAKALLDEFA